MILSKIRWASSRDITLPIFTKNSIWTYRICDLKGGITREAKCSTIAWMWTKERGLSSSMNFWETWSPPQRSSLQKVSRGNQTSSKWVLIHLESPIGQSTQSLQGSHRAVNSRSRTWRISDGTKKIWESLLSGIRPLPLSQMGFKEWGFPWIRYSRGRQLF